MDFEKLIRSAEGKAKVSEPESGRSLPQPQAKTRRKPERQPANRQG